MMSLDENVTGTMKKVMFVFVLKVLNNSASMGFFDRPPSKKCSWAKGKKSSNPARAEVLHSDRA